MNDVGYKPGRVLDPHREMILAYLAIIQLFDAHDPVVDVGFLIVLLAKIALFIGTIFAIEGVGPCPVGFDFQDAVFATDRD